MVFTLFLGSHLAMNKKVKTKGQIFIKELNISSFQLWKLKTESKRKVVKAGVTSLGPALQHKTFTCKNAFFDYDDYLQPHRWSQNVSPFL